MAFLKYRASLTPTVPTSNSVVSTGLTNLEVDGNFKSLDNAKVERSGDTITGSLTINTDLTVTGNSNINHTSGRVDGIPIGNTTAVTIVKVDNLSLDANTLSSTNTDGHIILAPNGAGDVQVDADTLRVGDSNAAATITTNGTGNLTLSTNAGTNSGVVTINQGAGGAIDITPNGSGTVNVGTATGIVNVKGNLDVDGDVNIDGGDLTVSTATFNLANTTATTLNLSGAATSVNIGHVGTAARTVSIATAATGGASTLTFGGAVTGNTLKVSGTAAGTTNYTSDVTTGTVNLFTGTTTGTVNVGSAAAGKLAVAFNTSATSTSTGALTVAGGVGVTENLWVGGYFNVDNLRLENNTISSTDTNGNIVLAPNGTGDVQVDADTLRVGDSNAAATITTNGTGNLTLSTNAGTSSGVITINQGANGNIDVTPNGTGIVNIPNANIDAGTIDGVSIGSAAVATFLAVDNLSLDASTLASTNTNGNINITPNGTGSVVMPKVTVSGGTIDGVSIGGTTVATFLAVDNLSLDTNTIASTNTNGNIVLAPNGTGDVQVDADTLRVGDSNVDATITTNGTGDLILNTNAGTNSGSIRIYDAANGNIDVTTNGTGVINLHDVTLKKWTAANADIDGLLPGTATGTIIEGPSAGHLVVGIRDDDANDSFSIVSGNGNYTSNTTYDAVVAYFKSTGDVGIGTSAPGAKLDVRGSAIFNEDGAAVDFRVEGDTNTNLLYTQGSTDRVGINTASPVYKLHVETAGQGTDGFGVTNSTNSIVLRPNSSAGNSNPLVQAQDKAIIYSNGTVETGNLVIAPWSTSNYGIRMTNAGNVGINISPNSAYALDVSGAIRNFGSQALLATSARADAQIEVGSSRTTAIGTWTASASATVTISSNSHGYITGNRADIVFTMSTGTNATSGNYVVSVVDVNTFTITNPSSITGTGTVTIGVAGSAYLDLVTDTTHTDYGFRIFRGNTGPNSATQLTNKGTGALSIQTESTGPVVINTNGTTRAIFDGNSHVVTFGNAGTSATPTASTIVGATGGSGTDISATQLILRGGLSTGSATGGSISFQTGTVGSTGTTAQTATERLRIDTSTASTTLDLVTPATTANVLNANATTLNLAGAATSVNVGHVGTGARTVSIATAATGGASTMTFGGAVTGNIFKVAGTAAGTTNYTSDVTTGTVNLFAGTTTGTVNVGSAAAGKLAVAFNTSATSTSTGALTVAGGASITENLWVGGYFNIDNLRLENNTLSSTNTDGNIVLAPNGVGDVQLDADTVRIGDAGAAATLTSNGAGALTVTTGGAANLVLNTNSGTNSGSITINNGANGNIVLTPNGTGDVYVDADTLRVGDAGAAAKLISNGAGALTVTTGGAANLVLSTNDGTTSGSITINNGANANIVVAPDGTGDVYLDADTVRVGDAGATATITTNGAGNLVLNTNAGTTSGSITINNGANGNIVIAPDGTGDVYVDADTLRVGDSGATATVTTNGAGNLVLNTNAGTTSGSITINNGANGNIVIAPDGTGDVYVDADTLRVGDSNAAATITTNGTGNLTLSTNAGTNSGTIVINQGANGNIVLTPNGTGDVQLDADTVRIGDLDSASTLTTNGVSPLTITAGTVGIASVGNTVTVIGGSGGATSGAGGAVTVQGGSATTLGSGGELNLYGGLSSGLDQVGSNTVVRAGNGTGTGGSGNIIFQTASPGSTGSLVNTITERFRINNAGNVLVGKTSAANEKLGIGGGTSIYSTGTSAIGIYDETTVSSAQTGTYSGVSTNVSTQATAFTLTNLTHYSAAQATLGSGSNVTNQYGYIASSSLVGAAFNYGFHSSIPLGSTATVANVARTTNVVTITTALAHGFTLGQRVTVAATTNTSVNGTFTITSVPTSTTFTYNQIGTDITLTVDTGSATITGRWNFYAAGAAPNYFAGEIDAASTTGSTSTSTGALRVAGGLGVAENLYVGGIIQIDNLRLDTNTLSSTNTNGNIQFQPNGTGQVVFNDNGANVDVRIEGDNDVYLLYTDASTDRIGIGNNTPQNKLHIQETSATTNAVVDLLRLDVQSSGTPANGFGVGIEFAVETTANNTEVGATIEAVTTDVTAGSEDFDIVFRTMIGGAAAAQVGKLNNNTLQIGANATATTLTTQGNSNLILTTGSANTGSITLNQAASGNITFALNGTGSVVLPRVTVSAGSIDGTAIGVTTRDVGNFTTLNANGNVTLGDAATDTVTVNGTVTSNLIFTDNTYDIGASGATRPRSLFLSQNATIGGSVTAGAGSFTTLAASDKITRSGNLTKASWTTSGVAIENATATFTDNTTAASGTVVTRTAISLNAPTFASTNAITVTDAANLYVEAPVAGTNTTTTNRWGIYNTGNEYVGGNLTVVGNALLNGNINLGNAAADNVTVTGTITSNLIFTDNTYDIGASGATRPRSLFLAQNATLGGNLVVDGNATLGNAAADSVTVNGTVTSNVIFTDNTYDIGASGATRPRSLFLSQNATLGGNLVVDGNATLGNAAADNVTVNGTIVSNLIFTDNTYDIGASGATRPRDLFLGRNATLGGSLTVNGSATVGDASTDTVTVNSTITSNLIFTDNAYDIGASGATRPRSLFLAQNATIGGSVTAGAGSFTTLAASDKFTRSGNLTKTSWTTSGVAIQNSAATFTDSDSAAASTVATRTAVSLNAPTFASTNAITVTDAANLYVEAPVAGTNTTTTNRWGIYNTGNEYVGGLAQIGNIRVNTNTISSTNTDGNIVIAPNGAGDVQVDADTLRVGDSGAPAKIISNGAGILTVTTGGASNLVLSTNDGTSSGTITINNGASGNIVLTPDGTGTVNVTKNLDVDGDVNIDGGDLTVSTAAFNLANTTVATLNLAGAATAVNVGHVGTAARTVSIATAATAGASTLTFGGAVTDNIFKVAGTAAGTTNYTSDVTTGTVNLFTGTTTGTVNVGSAAAGKLAVAFNTASTSNTTGALTVAGGVGVAGNLNVGGNATLGDASTDTVTVNSTITSNLIFTDNTYDIGASGATRPRDLFLARNATIAGSVTGAAGSFTTLAASDKFTRSGNLTKASWTTSGVAIDNSAATFTDSSTAASGTVATRTAVSLNAPTFASSNAITVTDAANLYVEAPIAGANTTTTNRWGIYNAGNEYVGGNLTVDGNTLLNGNINLGNAAADNVTVTGTITSNLIFTDNTYDIGANGATRPRDLYLAGNATIAGSINAGNISFASLSASDKITRSGNLSKTSWTTSGVAIENSAATFTDTSSAAASTVSFRSVVSLNAPTLASTNAITVTDAANLYVEAPIAGTNTTTTNRWGIYNASSQYVGSQLTVAGNTFLNGNITLGNATADSVTVTGTIVSNLIFTDNTYDIGASGATRPRSLFLSQNATIGGSVTAGAGSFTTLAASDKFTRSGNLTKASWTTSGVALDNSAATFTDNTTASGTVVTRTAVSLNAPTFASSNAITVTNAVNLYIEAPVAGTNTTTTNRWGIYNAGNEYVGGNLTVDGNAVLNGNVNLGNATADSVTVTGTIVSNLIFTDNTYDIGASGATRPRSLFLAQNATLGGNLVVDGNATLGNAAADTVTVNSTITSNLIFTDNTYDIGASGATRPRSLFLSQNATLGGSLTVNGNATIGDAAADTVTVNSTITSNLIFTDNTYDIGASGATRPRDLFLARNATIAGSVTGAAGSFTTLSASDKITRSGNLSKTSWTTAGVAIDNSAATFTDTSSAASATVATRTAVSLNAPTFASTNAITATNAINLYVEAPLAGTNTTTTNRWGIYNTGNEYVGGNLTVDGNAVLNGNVNLGNAAADNVTVTGTIVSNLIFTDNTYDIGASGATRPRSLFLAQNATLGGNLVVDGNATLGNAAADTVTVNGTVTSNLIFTDNTYDIGASGATRPRSLFLAQNATLGGNLTVNGNATIGDASTDTVTVNSTITSNLIFTDNTYDIGASGATRPRSLFLAQNATLGGNLTVNGNATIGDASTDTVTLNASLSNGTSLKTTATLGNTYTLQAYDNDDATYRSLVTLTAGNVPSIAIGVAGSSVSIDYASIGATSAGTGAFTTLSASSKLTRSGAITTASWTTGGVAAQFAANTFTDNTSAAASTVDKRAAVSLNAPTFASSNAITTTNAINLYVEAPIAGTNTTTTNRYGIYNEGNLFNVGNVNVVGALTVNGPTTFLSTSLTVTGKQVVVGQIAASTTDVTGTIGSATGIAPFTASITSTSNDPVAVGVLLTKTSGTGAFGTNTRVTSVSGTPGAYTFNILADTAITNGSITFSTSAQTDYSADQGGLVLKGTTDKSILWSDSTDSWTFNQNVESTGRFKSGNFVYDGTGTISLTNTTQTSIDSNAFATVRSVKYIIQATYGSEYQYSEIMMVTGGTTATTFLTEYANVFTGAAPLVSYDGDVSGSNMRLLATATTATTSLKILKIYTV